MTVTHRYIASVRFREDDDASLVSSSDITLTSSNGTEVYSEVPDGTTNEEHTFTIINDTGISSIYMLSNQDVTVGTNDSGSPDQTFSLVANEPVYWHLQLGTDRIITEDTDAIYITNNSGSTAIFRFKVAHS